MKLNLRTAIEVFDVIESPSGVVVSAKWNIDGSSRNSSERRGSK